jgi:hypothetical protein
VGIYIIAEYAQGDFGYMELAIKQECSIDLMDKIREITDMCRISRLEKLFSDFLEELPEETPINYIGDLNRNDVMH